MKLCAYVVIVYALLTFIGGFMGYSKAQSIVSLVAGLSFGLLLLVSAIAMLQGHVIGQYISLGLTVFLTAFFGYRFLTSYKFMPAGLMVFAGLIVLATFLIQTMTNSANKT